MKTTKFLLSSALLLALSGTAFAQNTPATSTVPNTGAANTNGGKLGTEPGSLDTNGNRVGTMNDGTNIGNNRDRLSSGAGTAPAMVDKQAMRTKETKRSRRTKVKTR